MDKTPPRRRAGRPANPLARSEILRSARVAFAQQGYGGASLDAIARSLGIRKASLLHHFASKEVLYREAVLELFGELKQIVIAALSDETGGSGGFAERLDRLNDAVTGFLHRNPEAAALIIRELTRPADDRPGTRRAADTLRVVQSLLSAGLRDGPNAHLDPGHLLMSIMGVHLLYFAVPLMSGTVVGREVFGEAEQARRAAEVRDQVRALCGLPAAEPGR